MRRLLMLLLKILLGVLALLLALAVASLLRAEWRMRHAVAAPTPTQFAIEGPEGAPVLILLHGAGLNGHMWDSVRRRLPPNYRVLALDLPGHGTRRGEVYTLEATRRTIAAAAAAVAPARVVLVGDSLGGYSAMAAAESVPSPQLAGLMIGGAANNWRWGTVPAYVGTRLMLDALLLRADEGELFKAALGRFGVEDETARALVKAGGALRAVADAERELLFVDFLPKLEALKARHVPVLIVNGSRDRLEGEDSFVAAAGARRYRFDNCEHGVSMRRPAEFAAQLDQFAREVTR